MTMTAPELLLKHRTLAEVLRAVIAEHAARVAEAAVVVAVFEPEPMVGDELGATCAPAAA